MAKVWLGVMCVAACGGGSDGTVDAAKAVDAAPPVDAPSSDAAPSSPWTMLSSGPSARDLPAVAYDEQRHVVVMFGGSAFDAADNGTSLDDLWEWNGATWTNRTPSPRPTSWPPARSEAVAGYDSARHRVVIFSGMVLGSVGPQLNDVWEWDGTAWTNRTPSPLPTTWPPDDAEQVGAFDAQRGRLVVWDGGRRLWELDPASATWTDRTPTTLPSAWPASEAGTPAVYDSVRHETLIFGGQLQHVDDAHLWGWNGTAWIDHTPSPLPAGWPSPRTGATLAFDGQRTLLFGGVAAATTTFDRDLFAWNGTAFATLTPAPLPAAWPTQRAFSKLVFAGDRTLLFGGRNDSGELADTWEYKP